MRHTSIVAGLMALTGLLVVGCGGGDDELAKAIDDLPRSALSTMVLTAEEFGSIADGFEIESDSGTQDNVAAADDSINPALTAGDLEAAGRLTGYELSFETNDAGTLETGEGILNISSEVELFESAGDASRDTSRKIEELHDFEGQSIEGLTMGPHVEFNVNGLGDESGGLEFSGAVDGLDLTVYVTVVYFRIGRLNASVVMSALDDQDLREEAEVAAKKQAARIEGVALGEIDEDPVEIPPLVSEPDTSQPADRPPGVPDLASVALRLSDLPEGFEVEEEAYEAPPDLEFAREFGVGDELSVQIGQTEVVAVQNKVMIHESATEATALLGLFESLLLSEEGQAGFAESFAGGAGFEPELSDFRSLPLEIGDEGVVILGLVKTGLGDFAFAFMLVRVEEAVAMINVTALASSFNLGDLAPLARIEEQRLRVGPAD